MHQVRLVMMHERYKTPIAYTQVHMQDLDLYACIPQKKAGKDIMLYQ